MDIITTLQVLVFGVYIGIVWYRFGVLEAISYSAYKWEGEKKWYFLLFMFLLGALNLLQNMEVYGVLTTAGLLFTGITVDYKENIAGGRWVHIVGVVTAILSTFIGLWVLYGLWWLFPLFLIGSLAIYTDPFTRPWTLVWWIEILAFLIICLGYYAR